MDNERVKELIEKHAEGIVDFEIQSNNGTNHVEVEAQYEFPYVFPMMNPFSLEKMLIVYDSLYFQAKKIDIN